MVDPDEPLEHAPSLLMLIFLLPDLQLARRKRHALLYVLPFEPHTGAYFFVHAISHFEVLTWLALVVDGTELGAAVAADPAVAVVPVVAVDPVVAGVEGASVAAVAGAGAVVPVAPKPHSPSDTLAMLMPGLLH